jgi:uncharacterized UPF0160 family protein
MLSIVEYKDRYEPIYLFQYQDLLIGPKATTHKVSKLERFDKISLGIWEVNWRYFSNLNLEKRHKYLRMYEYVKFSLDKIYDNPNHKYVEYKNVLRKIRNKVIETLDQIYILENFQETNILYESKTLSEYQCLYILSTILMPIIYYMDMIHYRYIDREGYKILNSGLFYNYLIYPILKKYLDSYISKIDSLVEDIFPIALIDRFDLNDPGKVYYSKYRTMVIKSILTYTDIDDEQTFLDNCVYIGDIVLAIVNNNHN